MGAPHNKMRYGETWPQERLDETLRVLEPFRTLVVLSGGWAWHFMSPEGHREYKHAHDHKDVDLFVHPTDAGTAIARLRENGFIRVSTKYDTGKKDFQRYEIVSGRSSTPFKITFDVFIRNVPFRVVRGLWRVVDPPYLVGLYDSVHSSSECFAVVAARDLLAQGVDPVNNARLVDIPVAR
jgi:hypothetical protein